MEYVWSDYEAVYHLEEDPTGTIFDSTANSHDLTGQDMESADSVSGQINDAIKKDTTEYFNKSGGISVSSGSDVTYQQWLYPTSWNGDNPGIWRDGSSSGGGSFNIFQGTSGWPWVRWNGADVLKPGSGYSVSLNTWTKIDFVVDSGNNAAFYADGTSEHSASHAVTTPAFSIYNIGYQFATTQEVIGTYDEIRIRFGVLSGDWLSAEYTNQNTTTTFYSVGSEESEPQEDTTKPEVLVRDGSIMIRDGDAIIRN